MSQDDSSNLVSSLLDWYQSKLKIWGEECKIDLVSKGGVKMVTNVKLAKQVTDQEDEN